MLLHHRGNSFSPRISIANTDQRIIAECTSILTGLGVKFCNYVQDKREVGGRQRLTLLVHVTNRPGVLAVIEAVQPFLVGKAEQAKSLALACKGWREMTIDDKHSVVASIKAMNSRVPRVERVDSSEAKSTATA